MSHLPPVTREKALVVLTALVNTASIKRVEIVGSVARKGQGNDLDLVLVVDSYAYIAFLRRMWEEMSNGYHYDCGEKSEYYLGFREQRMHAALNVISFTEAERLRLDNALASLEADVDFHLMPEDWKDNIDKVQQHLPHNDPSFVRNIADDARTPKLQTGVFVTGW